MNTYASMETRKLLTTSKTKHSYRVHLTYIDCPDYHFEIIERLSKQVYILEIEEVLTELQSLSEDILIKNKTFNSELRLLQLLKLVRDRRDEEVLPYAS